MRIKKLPASSMFVVSLILVAAFLLSGCYPHDTYFRAEAAKRYAYTHQMIPRRIQTQEFMLQAYERVRKNGSVANIYIEGDGDRFTMFPYGADEANPTPTTPVALYLAAKDPAPNVVYLGRPCQYIHMENNPGCDPAYWHTARYNDVVIQSIDQALNYLKRRYSISRFNLIGYQGGGAVAVLVAERRSDIASIRTIGGNLDHLTWSEMNSYDVLNESSNAIDVAKSVSHIPQRHFYGIWDEEMSPKMFQDYHKASGQSDCVKATIVRKATNERGWTERWPLLLKEPVHCDPIDKDQYYNDIP